jgi:cytoskeleton protein RodZ
VPREVVTFKTTDRPASPPGETSPAEIPCAPRAGSNLREARERLGWDLFDIAAMLRIRPVYLEALEEGRLDVMPGNAYAVAFMRNYATSLGLDAEEVARRFRAEAGEIRQRTELVFPVPIARRGLPAGALILLGMILVTSAYIAWYRLSGEGKLPAETVAPVPARLASLAEQAIPGPDGRVLVPEPPAPPPRPVEDNGQFEPRMAAAENPLLAPDPAPLAQPPVEEALTPPMPGGTATTAIAMPVTPPIRRSEVASPSAEPALGASDADGSRVLLRFTGDTWVQVKERGGQPLVMKVMKAGESYPVPARANLLLTTGNAGRVDILVDGALVPAIGGPGAVRKDVPLDPDQLKAGAATPAAAKR